MIIPIKLTKLLHKHEHICGDISICKNDIATYDHNHNMEAEEVGHALSVTKNIFTKCYNS